MTLDKNIFDWWNNFVLCTFSVLQPCSPLALWPFFCSHNRSVVKSQWLRWPLHYRQNTSWLLFLSSSYKCRSCFGNQLQSCCIHRHCMALQNRVKAFLSLVQDLLLYKCPTLARPKPQTIKFPPPHLADAVKHYSSIISCLKTAYVCPIFVCCVLGIFSPVFIFYFYWLITVMAFWTTLPRRPASKNHLQAGVLQEPFNAVTSWGPMNDLFLKLTTLYCHRRILHNADINTEISDCSVCLVQ